MKKSFKKDLTAATEAFQVESKKSPLYLITAEYRNMKSRHFVVVVLHGKKGTKLEALNSMGRMKAPALPTGYKYVSGKAVKASERGCPELKPADLGTVYYESEYTVELALEVVGADAAPKKAATKKPAAKKDTAKAAPVKADKPAAKKAEKAAPAKKADKKNGNISELIIALGAMKDSYKTTWNRKDGRVFEYEWIVTKDGFNMVCTVDASKCEGKRNAKRTTTYLSREEMISAATRIEARNDSRS